MIQDYSALNKQFSFLVLDYNRPRESEICLESIRSHVKFDNYEVVYFSNGGTQDYVYDFYKRGLIDRCILNSSNEGTGFGTMKLIQSCTTDFFMSIQCDNFFHNDFTQSELDSMIDMLTNTNAFCIDLAYADVNNNNFSERCYVMQTDYYNANPNQVGGGPGPYIDLPWTEKTTQDWIKSFTTEVEGKTINGVVWHWRMKELEEEYESLNLDISFPEWASDKCLIGNSGKYTVRSCKHNGQYTFRNDTQQLWVHVAPTQKSNFGKAISDEEWDQILNNKWKDGSVPEGQKRFIKEMWGPPTTISEDGETWNW